MGLTQKLGTLPLAILTDASNNVGIGGSPSGSYKLDVTGTAKVSSTLLVSGAATFSSTILAGQGTFQSTGANIISKNTTTSQANLIRFDNSTGGARAYLGYETTGSDFYFDNSENGSSIFITNNVERMRITSGGVVTVNQALSTYGTMAVKGNTDVYTYGGFNIYNNTNINFISIAINTTRAVIGADYAAGGSYMPLCFETGNTERMRITSGGNVGIANNGYSNYRVNIRGLNTASSDFTFRAEDSGTNTLFECRNDGLVRAGLLTYSPYNFSLTGHACYINSSGEFGYLSSTRESKANIESIKSVNFINQLNPVQFNYRKKNSETNEYTDELYDNINYGFIADEVEKVNKDLVFYKSDGTTLAGVEYNSMIAILTKAIQEQNQTITSLQDRLDKAGL